MLFNSFEFLVFLIVTFGVYYLPGLGRLQVLTLTLASGIFYAWKAPELLILLAISILINATTSYFVNHEDDLKKRTQWAAVGVVVNLGILAFFKYAGLLTRFFLSVNHSDPNGFSAALLHIPLPIGISFYTFEGISLLVDSYRKQKNVALADHIYKSNYATHLTRTTLFTAFFPHLIAGPILKASHFFPQIGEKKFSDINWDKAVTHLVLGYFLKTVVADNLFDQTFYISYPFYKLFSLSTSVVMLFGYSIQIFSDFAGYSLIAIGLGYLFGYDLPANFNFPYISRSLSEFWRRWHISLSTWLRDYLYIPLGGNRKGAGRTYLNLMIVMALGGLWHGAAWGYMVWGIYHGVGLAIERLLSKGEVVEIDKDQWTFKDWFSMLWVFGFVTIGWTLFKLPDFHQALDFAKSAFSQWKGAPEIKRIVPILFFAAPTVIFHLLKVGPIRVKIDRYFQPHPQRRMLVKALVLGVMLFLILVNRGNANQFIYFQF